MPGRLFVPLRSTDYRKLWLGQLISVLGDKVDQIALGILVYQATGSELQMGLMLAITMLPSALFGLFAGAYVDRRDRRRTMIAADVARALLVLSVPFVAGYSIVAVYVVALLVATVSLFFEPAKLSLIPELVDRSDLMAANSLDNATVSVAELVGLALAAGLVAGVGYRVAFYFDAATYLLSAALIFAIGHRAEATATGVRVSVAGMTRDVVDGLRFVGRHVVLRDLLPIYAAAQAGVAASITFVYVLALDRFAAGATGLAAMDGSITVGLLLGSLLIGRSSDEVAIRNLLGGLTVFAVLLASMAVLPSIGWSIPVLLVMGMANMYFYVPMSTVIQGQAAPSMRGRVFAAKQTLARLFNMAGLVAAGALAEGIGLSASIYVSAALVAVMALIGWSRPHLRSA